MNSNYPDLYDTSVEKFTSFFVFPFSVPFKTQFGSNAIWKKSDFSIPQKPDEIRDWKYQKNYAESMKGLRRNLYHHSSPEHLEVRKMT